MGVRHPFGIQPTDWAFVAALDGITPQLVSASVLTLWNAQTGGSQITDLTADSAGLEPITTLTASDGTDGYTAGQIEQFWGPEDVTSMWISADAGGRLLLTCTDVADMAVSASSAAADANAAAASVAATVAGLDLGDLADVDTSGVTDGSVLVYDSGASMWEPGSASGLADGAVTTAKLADNAVTTIKIADSNVTIAKIGASTFNTQVQLSRLDQMAAPTASVPFNSHKATGLAAGTASGDALSYGQSAAALTAPVITGAATAVDLVMTGKLVVGSDALSVVSSHVSTDASTGNYFRVACTANFTLDNPTNPTDGQTIEWEFVQDGTGSRVMTLGSAFALGTDITVATLTTTANKRDFLVARYNSTATKWYIRGFIKGY